MDAFSPWESAPHLAVAVSGGADSLALAMLAQRWASARGGHVTALMVDHGLRPEAPSELAYAAACLAPLQIPAVILPLSLDPHSATHETARTARYGALESWCRAHRVLHLLLGHHGDDQAETVLLRLLAGSRPSGLAAMAGCVESGGLRKLRPLLAASKSALERFLREQAMSWIEDPSNQNPRYARSHLRQTLSQLPLSQTQRLQDCAKRLGVWRARQEQHLAQLLVQYVRLWPQGVGVMCGHGLAHPRAAEMLSAMLCTLGGTAHPPRHDAIGDALARLRMGKKGTLHGCVMESRPQGGVLIYREYQATAALQVQDEAGKKWDRFAIYGSEELPASSQIRALGPSGFQQRKAHGGLAALPAHLPYRACLALPAVWHLDECTAAPHIENTNAPELAALNLRFCPVKPLGMASFSVMNGVSRKPQEPL